jgi:glycosyltransferase involved in cell wall biosynthesis
LGQRWRSSPPCWHSLPWPPASSDVRPDRRRHGFSSPRILPVYRRCNQHTFYVSISKAYRQMSLAYVATAYEGIDIEDFTFRPQGRDELVFFGRIHPDKGTREAIEIARRAGRRLRLAGIIQDEAYFKKHVEPTSTAGLSSTWGAWGRLIVTSCWGKRPPSCIRSCSRSPSAYR